MLNFFVHNLGLFSQDWGVAHGDDIMYLSKMVLKGKVMAGSEEDKRMVDIYRKLITNFIR